MVPLLNLRQSIGRPAPPPNLFGPVFGFVYTRRIILKKTLTACEMLQLYLLIRSYM